MALEQLPDCRKGRIMCDLRFMPHQEEVLDLTEDKNRCAYYLDMGLGKTFVGAE